MKVKVQEYIRNEKYYIIKTNKTNQYLGMSYNAFDNNIIFQRFSQGKTESGYLQPSLEHKFTLKLAEAELLLRTMTVLWNTVKKDNIVSKKIYNKDFGIRNFGGYDVNIKIKKDILDFKYISIEKTNKIDLPSEDFSIYLDYVSSKTLYSIIKQLLKKKTVNIHNEEESQEDRKEECYV